MEPFSVELFTITILLMMVLLLGMTGIKILPMNHVMVIERLGGFHKIIDLPGVHFLIPFMERARSISTPFGKTYKLSLLPQSIPLQSPRFNASIMFQITDVKLFVYASSLPYQAIGEQLHKVIDHHVSSTNILFAIQDIKSQIDTLLTQANERSNALGFRYLELNHIETNNR